MIIAVRFPPMLKKFLLMAKILASLFAQIVTDILILAAMKVMMTGLQKIILVTDTLTEIIVALHSEIMMREADPRVGFFSVLEVMTSAKEAYRTAAERGFNSHFPAVGTEQ